MDRTMQMILGTLGDPGLAGLGGVLALGLFGCFLGRRFFRLSAALIGLIVGVEFFGELVLDRGWSPTVTMAIAVGGGVALGALLAALPPAGVFGLGALLTASLVSLAARAAGEPMRQWVLLAPTAAIGGLGALAFRPVAVALATALFGGVATVAGLFALVKDRQVSSAVRMIVAPQAAAGVPVAWPNVASPVAVFLLCVTILVTAGLVVQFRYGKNAAVNGAAAEKK